MCRILVYGCPAVAKQIATEGAETLISCKYSNCDSKEEFKTEKFDAEIIISHTQLPESHKLIFIQALKEEEPETKDDFIPELAEKYEVFVEAFESTAVKEESRNEEETKEEQPDEEDEIAKMFPKKWYRNLGPPPYKCPKCQKILGNRFSYKIHILRQHYEKKYSCQVCSKGFLTAEQLHHHMPVHTGEKIFICHHCDKTYKTLASLKVHITAVHISAKGKVCSKTLKNSFIVRKYHRNSHTNANAPDYICELCGKGLKSTASLKNHMLLHEERQHFKCDLCPKTYTLRDSLKSHMEVHSTKEYVCNICGKYVTKRKCYLRRHMATHKVKKANRANFPCTLCGSRLFSKMQLTRHMNGHLGIRNFQCDFCDKTFIRREHAQRHMALHKKEGTRFRRSRTSKYLMDCN